MTSKFRYLASMFPPDHAAYRRLRDALTRLDAPPCDPVFMLSDDPHIRAEAARLTCPPCPVLEECRDAGRKETFGVWGGKDRTPPPSTTPRR